MTGHGRWSAALAGVMVAAMGVGGVPAGAADTPGESSGGAAAAAAVVPYTTVDLGALAVDWFPNFSVNERGQVAGKDMSSAFLWDPDTGKRELSVDPWRWDGVADLNERGQVAGTAFTRSGDAVIFRSVLWDPVTGMRDLGTLPGGNWSATTALNEQGQVAGTATTKSGAQHAFLWDPDTGMRDLGAGTGIWSEAVAVNERGQVAGTVDPDSANRSFLWDPVHGMQDLGTHPGGEWSVTTDLNERGQVVGSATTVPCLSSCTICRL
jgi:probable HAF family extracellular repeat protein